MEMEKEELKKDNEVDASKRELDEDGLPQSISLEKALENLPPLAPALIEGILRKGHKMLISGSSKAGKSFLLMQLAIALAKGREWLGFKCKKSSVLYVNLEIDSASCINRFVEIYKRLGIEDRKSTRLNSSHVRISYAVFCLKKKTKETDVRAYAPLTHLPPAPLGQRFHDVLLHQPPAQLLRCVHYN